MIWNYWVVNDEAEHNKEAHLPSLYDHAMQFIHHLKMYLIPGLLSMLQYHSDLLKGLRSVLEGLLSQFTLSPPWHFLYTVYPKKYAHGFCFAVLCCGYALTDFPISIRPTSLALWQSNDCPSASKATLMNMDKYFMWIHYERLHNHNKAKHNKTVCIFLGMYCNRQTEALYKTTKITWTITTDKTTWTW